MTARMSNPADIESSAHVEASKGLTKKHDEKISRSTYLNQDFRQNFAIFHALSHVYYVVVKARAVSRTTLRERLAHKVFFC